MRKLPVLLKFESGDYRLSHVSLSGIRLLGGTLLVPQSPDVYELLFQHVARFFPDCDAIEMSGLPTKSALWDFLRNSHSLTRDFTIYAAHGPRNCDTAQVPGSFSEYLGSFGCKKQYNLKRQIRRLD